MNNNRKTGRNAPILGVLLSIAMPLTALAGDNQDVFIFGDSLSDSGNVYAAVPGNETSKAPYAVVPSLPYAIGGHHFSNGKTWAERLAQSLSDNAGGKASLDAPGKNGNYAFGGARIVPSSTQRVPDAKSQILMYLGDYGMARDDALYVYQFGGNDIRDSFGIFMAQGPAAAIGHIHGAALQAGYDIEMLYAAGAREILVANAPNLEHAPAVKMAGASALGSFMSATFNGILEGELLRLGDTYPDLVIHRLDMAAFINEIVADGSSFGFENVENPCLYVFLEDGGRCDNPDEFLFWDGIHPTAAAHKVLGQRALEAISQ
jgi:phospholipase/lecithinase/hemolysin